MREVLIPAHDRVAIEHHCAEWTTLSRHALDPNPYFMPAFVLAASRYLDTSASMYLLFIYEQTSDPDGSPIEKMILMMPLRLQSASIKLPRRQWSSKAYEHCYLGHPLLARESAERALAALFRWLDTNPKATVLVFNELSESLATTQLLMRYCQSDQRHHLCSVNYQRPVLRRQASYDAHLATLSSSNRKRAKQLFSKLTSNGSVAVSVHLNASDRTSLSERFMAMEMSGWKGQAGTALGSTVANRAFFHDLMSSVNDDLRVFFIEITLDGKPLAMTSNFIVNDRFYAFKVASDDAYSKFSPGIAVEYATVEKLYEHTSFTHGDSGAGGNSYVQAIWGDSDAMMALYVPRANVAGYFLSQFLHSVQSVKKWYRRICVVGIQSFKFSLGALVADHEALMLFASQL